MANYIHGDDPREQQRLVEQAAFWRRFILDGLDLRPGQSLLEVGCGAGAVLGVIAEAHPGVRLAGLDLSSRQIEAAARHLRTRRQGSGDESSTDDLRVGNAADLPWPDGAFDHVFFMWMLEHLPDGAAGHQRVLKEARRVLRPGGRITITETDYTFVIAPEDPDFAALMEAWRGLFDRRASRMIARRLGPELLSAGFSDVRVVPRPLHSFSGERDEAGRDKLEVVCRYIADFIEPEVAVMASEVPGAEEAQLLRGVRALRTLHSRSQSSFTGLVFRATARA